ncbi:MAG: VanZ family protein [Lachnospiraceae bacterium]|nr:VanZ family protein [Lachnospiraceae bacterium]
MRNWFSRIVSAVLTIGWLAVIFAFSGQDSEESSGLSDKVVNGLLSLFTKKPVSENVKETLTLLVRKGAHMTEFAILAVLLLWTVSAWTGAMGGWVYLTAFAAAVTAAALDEFHQTFVPGRAGRPTDVLIDSCGILLALGVCFLIFRKKKTAANRRRDSEK